RRDQLRQRVRPPGAQGICRRGGNGTRQLRAGRRGRTEGGAGVSGGGSGGLSFRKNEIAGRGRFSKRRDNARFSAGLDRGPRAARQRDHSISRRLGVTSRAIRIPEASETAIRPTLKTPSRPERASPAIISVNDIS